MNIREAECRNAEAISVLAITLSKKYVTSEFPASVTKAFLNSMTSEAIENNLRNAFRYHIAEINDRVIGAIGIKDNSHLYHLFVSENHHRKGVARKLWNTAKETCIANGNNEGFTVNSSKYAQEVYEKLGFVAQSGQQERNGVVTTPMKLKINY